MPSCTVFVISLCTFVAVAAAQNVTNSTIPTNGTIANATAWTWPNGTSILDSAITLDETCGVLNSSYVCDVNGIKPCCR